MQYLTDKIIIKTLDVHMSYWLACEANTFDDKSLKEIGNQLNSLQEFKNEIGYNTDISIKAIEKIEELQKTPGWELFDEDGEYLTSNTIDEAVDVVQEYKINEHLIVSYEKAKDLFSEALRQNNDQTRLNHLQNEISYYSNFKEQFDKNPSFKEVVVKSRFKPLELDNLFKKNGFNNINDLIKYIPEERELIYAEDGALNSSKHLTINKMEKQSKKTVVGFIASISEPKKFDSGKEVINLSIGTNEKDAAGKTVYVNASVWFDTNKNQDSSSFKFTKGNNVEVKGIDGLYKDKPVFTVFPSDVKLVENKKSETITVKGNIANDLKSNIVNENKVTSFSLAIQKEGSEKPDFVNVYGWEKNKDGAINKDLYELSTGKKGDFIEVSGYYKPNNYTDNSGKTVESKDLVITSYKTISTSLSRNSSQEMKDNYLVNSLNSGNFKEVEVALKSGASLDIAKSHDISRHSEKQQKAINDVVSRFELSLEKKNNKGIKL